MDHDPLASTSDSVPGPLPLGGPLGGPMGDTAPEAKPAPCGLTRVTFAKGEHRFDFRCEPGEEAFLARVVLEMSRQPAPLLEPSEAFALCRQIVSLGPPSDSSRTVPGGTPGSSASDAPDGSASAWHKKAA